MAVKEWSTTASDNDDADATINWLEGMAPSGVNDSARAMMAAIASWYALIDGGTISGGTVGGTADAITLTNSPTVSALAAGQRYLFRYTSSGNTGAVTLSVDGIGSPLALRYKDVALIAGDIATNDWVLAVHDGTRFQMLNPPRLSWATTDIPTDTSGGAVADLFLFLDASQSNALNAVTVQKLLDNAMTGLTADTTPDVADSLLTYDASANAAKTTTASNFYKTINTLTEDTTPDGANDLFVTYDNSASGPKKVKPQSFAATQAQQETGSAITNFVTPGRQHFHQSAAKVWVKSIVTAGVPSSPGDASYNITSVADSGPGRATFTIATDFSSANWACLITPEEAGSLGENIIAIASGTQAAGTVELNFQSESGAFNDPDSWHMVGFGDFA
jgi:hypothetical protein